jgi:predicted RND superfamily exporter protein
LFRIREELALSGRYDVALRRALVTSGKAVFFVSSAIAAGYSTLCLSGFAFHVRLGGLVSLAMVVSSLATLLLLPALVAAFQPRFLERTAPAGAAVRSSAAA